MQLDLDSFRNLEESLLAPGIRASRQRLNELIADDFVEYGVSGRVFGKLDVLEAADRLPDVETPLTDFAVEALSDSVSLVTHGVELNSMTSDKHCSAEFRLGPRQRSPAVPVPAGNARGGETATVTRLAHLTNKRINTTRTLLSC